jgi:hypothetical protein
MGKDQVVHPRDTHDDYANVCCGALYGLANHLGAYADLLGKVTAWDDEGDYETNQEARDRAYRNQLAQRIFALSGGMCWPR